jgi:hypothetical protein
VNDTQAPTITCPASVIQVRQSGKTIEKDNLMSVFQAIDFEPLI